MAATNDKVWRWDVTVINVDNSSNPEDGVKISVWDADSSTTTISQTTAGGGVIAQQELTETSVSVTGTTETPDAKTPHVISLTKFGLKTLSVPTSFISDRTDTLRMRNDVVRTETNRTTINGYSEFTINHTSDKVTVTAASTFARMYDKLHVESDDSPQKDYPEGILPYSSPSAADMLYDWDITTGQFNLQGKTMTMGAGKVLTISGTGDITNGTIVGDVYINRELNLSNLTVDGNIYENTGANSTLSWTNVTITTGNVWNDATGNTLTINRSGGSFTAGDPGTLNGQTNVVSSVPITVTVKDESTGSPIQNANVQLYLTSDYTTEVLSTGTNASGVASGSWSGATGGIGIEGWARQVDLIGTDYEPKNITGTIETGGFSTTVLLEPSS